MPDDVRPWKQTWVAAKNFETEVIDRAARKEINLIAAIPDYDTARGGDAVWMRGYYIYYVDIRA